MYKNSNMWDTIRKKKLFNYISNFKLFIIFSLPKLNFIFLKNQKV